jgi:hypothetical protein
MGNKASGLIQEAQALWGRRNTLRMVTDKKLQA